MNHSLLQNINFSLSTPSQQLIPNLFNNCNSKTNGELNFYLLIKNNINIIFDVGCKTESEFLNFVGEVHYFDPVEKFVKELSQKSNNNILPFFNNFGLGNNNEKLDYYPSIDSFNKRTTSLPCRNYDEGKLKLEIRKGSDYVKEKNIKTIDFLKIDTEGFEFDVLKGFEEELKNIKIIQFEYGGCYLDNNVKLNDIIKYLQNYGFHKFSYLHPNGKTDFESLKGEICQTNPGHRNGQWSYLSYPETVQYMDENGFIPDHYNYCNIVCINKNCHLQHFF